MFLVDRPHQHAEQSLPRRPILPAALLDGPFDCSEAIADPFDGTSVHLSGVRCRSRWLRSE